MCTRAALIVAVVSCVYAGCIDSEGLSDAKCLSVCGGICTDTASDPRNCGGCGNACQVGQVCNAGTCGTNNTAVCDGGAGDGGDGGATACGASCVDLQTDPGHCGSCEKSCGGSETCIAGACVPKGTKQYALLAGQLGSWGNLDGTGTNARWNGPAGICVDGTNLYVTDINNCTVRKVDTANGTTTTFAGTIGYCSRVDGAGGTARFNKPHSCTLGAAGEIYITEREGCSIRKVVLATGAVTTLTGSIGCGYEDGAAAVARLGSPHGIAYDGASSLYVADFPNHAIRQIDTTSGAITTVAGAPPPTAIFDSTDDTGTLARFKSPAAVAFDSASSSLYVADYENHTIRKVHLPDFVVTTVVGAAGQEGNTNATGTAARLRRPIGLAVNAGSLYISEDYNHDIRVASLTDFAVTTSTGVSTVAGYADGTGTAALYEGPRAIAFDGAGNHYVADFLNHAVRKVVTASSTVTTLSGLGAKKGATDGAGASATFNGPFSLAYDGKDTIYVSDYDASTIRKVSLGTGTVSTLAGTAGQGGNVDATGTAARFANPAGIVLDADASHLYVADRANHTIRRINLPGGEVTTIAGSAGNPGYQEGMGTGILFDSPFAIAHDRGNPGKLYVADSSRGIREIALGATATSTLLAGAVGQSTILDAPTGTNARFQNITAMVTKGDGKLYIADANRIRVVTTASGGVLTLSGGGGYSDGRGQYANFNFEGTPTELSFDEAGDLLIADYNNHVIRKFSLTTLDSQTIGGIFGANGGIPGPLPTSITTQPRGVVAIPNGFAFSAYQGIFTVR